MLEGCSKEYILSSYCLELMETKWSNENLFVINLSSRSQLKINSCPILSFKLSSVFCTRDMEDVDHLVFYYPFSHHICYDLCSKCYISFWHWSWLHTISWLSNLNGSYSLVFMIMILMVAFIVYYIWREMNAWLHGNNPCNSLMVYTDTVS